MRHSSISIFLLLAFSAVCQTLTIDRTKHDFGKIQETERAQTKFKLVNTGVAELIVTEVKTSCGCTAGTLRQDRLQPGEKTWLDVSFDPTGKAGSILKAVEVMSNDPVKPRQSLQILAEVIPLFSCHPRKLEFRFENGYFDKATKTFRLSNDGTELLKLLNAGSNKRKMLRVEGPEITEIKPGEAQQFKVSISPEFKPKKTVYLSVFIVTEYGGKKMHRSVRVLIQVPTASAAPTP